jgi:hypothetical protein
VQRNRPAAEKELSATAEPTDSAQRRLQNPVSWFLNAAICNIARSLVEARLKTTVDKAVSTPLLSEIL